VGQERRLLLADRDLVQPQVVAGGAHGRVPIERDLDRLAEADRTRARGGLGFLSVDRDRHEGEENSGCEPGPPCRAALRRTPCRNLLLHYRALMYGWARLRTWNRTEILPLVLAFKSCPLSHRASRPIRSAGRRSGSA